MINQKYTNLNDGLKIPTVGFGTWKVSDTEAPAVVEEALAAGYRSIDTAAIYGNESGVGTAIKNSSVDRAEIFLTTKVWNSEQGYDSTLRAMDTSLKKLKTDYVDLYLIHWPMPAQDKYVATWKALNRLRTEGIARSIGVCNFNIDHLERLIGETGVIPVLNQVELHPYFQQKELRDFHAKHNIATEAWSPLARGKLFEDKVIVELAKKYNKTPSQIVLRWHFENGIIAIPKSSHTKRILENIDIFDFNLEASDLALISTIDDVNGRTSFDPATAVF
ncbi:aldo/keto reductase [Bacteriovorax sp. PP10]|uniref:Aldo/keto reductase n=1 Tax=Bacteriovorax antarcticus TaxID=3088717 RepID=A0ABU5VT60_9BACT|nr:aldo/keto reductase [Bacteriovorax sp. PP10]MEA9356112.1 aldo/keto reductase [Bacteriovorax sp. PP10]